MPSRFPPEAFKREDESLDALFYTEPRLVKHIDDYAVAAVGEAYRRFLREDGEYLDLMSSWVSHFPDDFPIRRMIGLGMNEDELRANPRLSSYVVRDLNLDPTLPYEDDRFDGVTLAVSVQYLTQPVKVFAEIARVLKPMAPLIVSFSNRCFPTKAVRIWLSGNSRARGRLIASYMDESGRFEVPEVYDFSPALTFHGVPEDPDLRHRIAAGQVQTDPLHVVVGRARLFGF
jgi:SAM-dependent methyltransferase